LFWLGFRREYVVYQRAARLEGRSAWTTSKKLRYGLNSIFSFTDLPVRLLLYLGSIAFVAACIASGVVIGPNSAATFRSQDIPRLCWQACSSAR
jgi:hypothetical protein